MKNILNIFILSFLLLGIGSLGISLDIPLSGGTDGGAGQRIGYVDLEQIFQIYPQTKFAKEDYSKRRAKMRESLAAKEGQLQEIKSRLSILKSTLSNLENENQENFQVENTTATEVDDFLDDVSDNPQALEKLQAELAQKETELEEEKARAKKELRAFEKQQSQIILGKIYQALKELALEEQVTLVVDKTSILFGSAEIDLTEKLQEKVRGF